MEETSLSQGTKRVKFELQLLPFSTKIRETYFSATEELAKLGASLSTLEKHGAAPILPDGKVGGNGAILFSDENGENLFVSKSGKVCGEDVLPEHFCAINKFERDKWKASFYSPCNSNKPSSDTPLLWTSIMEANKRFPNWESQPKVALHGHAIADQKAADELNLPISIKETLFSTPEDLDELERLFEQYPYPKHQIYIRKNHGFFLLADSIAEAVRIYENSILPYLIRLR